MRHKHIYIYANIPNTKKQESKEWAVYNTITFYQNYFICKTHKRDISMIYCLYCILNICIRTYGNYVIVKHHVNRVYHPKHTSTSCRVQVKPWSIGHPRSFHPTFESHSAYFRYHEASTSSSGLATRYTAVKCSKSYNGSVMERSTTKRISNYGKDSGGCNKIIMKKQRDLQWFTGYRVEASLSGPNPSSRIYSRVQSLDLKNVQRGTGKNDQQWIMISISRTMISTSYIIMTSYIPCHRHWHSAFANMSSTVSPWVLPGWTTAPP